MSSSTTLNAADLRRIVRGVRAFGSRPGLRRHTWTAGELQELCRAYIQHSRQIPLWKIAEMLHTTFSYPKHDICEDEDHVPPQRAPGYAVVPSIPAITAKLVNCIYLETGGELGYTNMKPSELQTQVWEHLLQSRQHHAMIQAMKSSSLLQCQSTPIKAEQHQDESALRVAPGAPVKPKSSARSRIGHVRPRDSDDEEEFKTEQPPTKRRKIIFDDDDEVASETPTEIQTYTPTAAVAAAAESESSIHFNEVADALSEIEQEISQENHNNPTDATCGLDMMYSDDSDDYDVYNDPDNSYNMHYEQHLQQQRAQQEQERHSMIMAALNRISSYEQQIGDCGIVVGGIASSIENLRRAIADEVATLTQMLNPPQELAATDDANDADAMSECDGECCEHEENYLVDGHEVSSWIYNQEYEEESRPGDYDHHEECS
jgi:hypothetical protein